MKKSLLGYLIVILIVICLAVLAYIFRNKFITLQYRTVTAEVVSWDYENGELKVIFPEKQKPLVSLTVAFPETSIVIPDLKNSVGKDIIISKDILEKTDADYPKAFCNGDKVEITLLRSNYKTILEEKSGAVDIIINKGERKCLEK